MKYIYYIIFTLGLTACATIPKESVQVAEAIQNQGAYMHQLNIAVVNALFEEKSKAIDSFIEHVYTPDVVNNFFASVPADTDFQKEAPSMVSALLPVIYRKQAAMKTALEKTRVTLITSLQEDYQLYSQATADLKALLESAVKVDDARKEALAKISQVTNNKVDISKISSALDDFIFKAGKTDMSKTIGDLEKTIEGLLKK